MGALLGMAAAMVGESSAAVRVTGTARLGASERAGPRVVDLSALWAGPVCTHLLARVGASVVRVESPTRRDGARPGVRSFNDLLNHEKAHVVVDLSGPDGRRALQDLVGSADVVVSSWRRRAVDQLGLDPEAVARRRDGPGVGRDHRSRMGGRSRRLRRRRRRGWPASWRGRTGRSAEPLTFGSVVGRGGGI